MDLTRDLRKLGPLGGLVVVLLGLAMVFTPLSNYNPFFRHRIERRRPTTLVAPSGEVLWATALPVYRGDEYWHGPEERYVVEHIDGDVARLRAVAPGVSLAPGVAHAAADLAIPLATAARVIGIYHTHSDESFVPTQGRSSIWGRGGIIEVGAVFAEALESHNFTVIHDRTPHDPHDAGAYGRSRRTALNLIRTHRPYAVFDVHRDAVPARFYRTTIDGQATAQMVLVIGRSNPLRQGNTLFARRLMAVGAGIYPDLIRGIFVGRGAYNQDLDPGLILVEAGTYLMSQSLVERGIARFAEVVAATAGAPGR